MSDAPHVFSDEYYARLARIEESHWWALGMRALATRLLDPRAAASRDWRVLDAGCGTGLTLTWLKRYSEVEPVGLDVARAGLKFCARRGHTRLVEATALELPFPSEYFDLVVSMDMLQHLPRPHGDQRALAEMGRVLKRGGLLFLRTNSRCGYAGTRATNYYRYSLSEIRELAEEAGLAIATATYANFLPALLATARRKWMREPPNGADPGLTLTPRPPQTNLASWFLYRALLAEGIYLSAAQRSLPFGHSILILASRR